MPSPRLATECHSLGPVDNPNRKISLNFVLFQHPQHFDAGHYSKDAVVPSPGWLRVQMRPRKSGRPVITRTALPAGKDVAHRVDLDSTAEVFDGLDEPVAHLLVRV